MDDNDPKPTATPLDDFVGDQPADTVALSAKEQKILELYDELLDKQIEARVLQTELEAAQNGDLEDIGRESDDDALQKQLTTAEREHVDARAAFVTRNQIVLNTLITDPILKAVHLGANSSPLERKLLPMIHRRDTLSMIHSVLAKELEQIVGETWAANRASIATNAENQELARQLLELTEALKDQKPEDIADDRLREKMQTLEKEVRKSRREWRTVKSVLSAVIAASGVEWAKDVGLRELVMDDEDELE